MASRFRLLPGFLALIAVIAWATWSREDADARGSRALRAADPEGADPADGAREPGAIRVSFESSQGLALPADVRLLAKPAGRAQARALPVAMRPPDAEGQRLAELPAPGRWLVRAETAGQRSEWQSIEAAPLRDGDAPPELALELDPTVVLQGRVLDDRERGLEGVRVAAALEDGDEWFETSIAADGGFQLELPEAGAALLVVGAHERPLLGPQIVACTGAPTDALSLHVPELAELAVEVVDAQGEPVPAAVVACAEQGFESARRECTTDASGRALLRWLRVGSYAVHAEQLERGAGDVVLRIGEELTRADSAQRSLRVHLPLEPRARGASAKSAAPAAGGSTPALR